MSKRTPPIVDPGYTSGVKVVDFGDVRVRRGMTRRPPSACGHLNVFYDTHERRIWCADCESDVEAFDAFVQLVQHHDEAWQRVERARDEVNEAAAFQVRSLAAKHIDKAWRRRNSVPACPHCGEALLPEDFKHGVTMTMSRAIALQRRKARSE